MCPQVSTIACPHDGAVMVDLLEGKAASKAASTSASKAVKQQAKHSKCVDTMPSFRYQAVYIYIYICNLRPHTLVTCVDTMPSFRYQAVYIYIYVT